MMRKPLSLRTLFLIVAAACAMSALAQEKDKDNKKAAPADTAAPAIDPDAINALKDMSAYLRTLKTFEIKATTLTEDVTDEGFRLQFTGNVALKVRRPDRLRADISSDRKQRQIFYDGKSVTLYGPRVKYYATVGAPPTLRETVEQLAKKYGIELPLADLFYWGTEQSPLTDIKVAHYIGPATVEGTQTDQFVYRQEGVDWQLWIQKGSIPVPRKLTITSTDKTGQPEYSVTMRWNVAPKLNDTAFVFKPPEGAMKIVLQTVDGKVESLK